MRPSDALVYNETTKISISFVLKGDYLMQECLDPITYAVSFFNGFKNIRGKACVNRVHNNHAFVNVGNNHTRKILGIKFVCNKIKSHECFDLFLH